MNPGGSVKDRIGLAMIEAAEEAGALEAGGTIVEGDGGKHRSCACDSGRVARLSLRPSPCPTR